MNWRSIWLRKGSEARGRDLADLIAADGFDGGLGRIDVAAWRRQAARLRGWIGPARRVLEVGCGAGAMLAALGLDAAGVDYSTTHLGVARRALPGLRFAAAEARALPFPDGAFDAVFAHSVFQYFPSEVYARAAVAEMRRVSRGRVVILDVPDLARKAACEAARGVSDPPHRFYPRDFFGGVVFEQDLSGYGNASYRFNAVIGGVE